MSPTATVQSVSVLLEFVQSIATVNRKSHGTHYHHNGNACHKQNWIASQHGHFCSKVAATKRFPLDRFVCAVVVAAAKYTHSLVVVSKAGDFDETATAFVAEVRAAAIARHVVAAGRALDEDAASGTFLAVGDSVWSVCAPLLELLVAFCELFAGYVLMPWGMALEAPFNAAIFALNLYVFFMESPHFASRELVFGDVAAVWASFPVSIAFCVDPHPLIASLFLCV